MNPQLNEENKQMWDQNAEFWDTHMGKDGNNFHKQVIAPKTLEFLTLNQGNEVLDIGCGNGLFSRRMATQGVKVCAFDFSAQNIAHAKSYDSSGISYQVLDATDKHAMLQLGEDRFDAAVSNMVIMDIPVLEPMFAAVYALLKKGGCFVFSFMHPSFNTSSHTLLTEAYDLEGRWTEKKFVKVGRYMSSGYTTGEAILGQPIPQYYFHRPLSAILQTAFKQGFVLNNFAEPIYPSKKETFYQEIPLVVICSMKKI